MKLNILNKIYIMIAVILVIAIIYKKISYKAWSRYYYASSVCTPNSNPAFIHNSYFLTADSEDNAWINNEEVNSFSSNWGSEPFLETHKPLLLPNKLVLQYASYREKKFYSDTLDLPYNRIKQIFDNAKQHNNLQKIYNSHSDLSGLHFLVGIAQNGNIIVWLRGVNLEEVILKTKIYPKEPKDDETYFEKRLPKNIYLEKVFEYLSDSLKIKINNGWEANANYIDTATNYLEQGNE